MAPLGRGGMGEVYRADDIRLGQTVALKFLPWALERDTDRLALLLDEVKLARQVSHPNVCRVWDAGETDGLHFVAMEYVDGEDLRSLLRRIGRLPEERGVQIAREICAGLAAIHDQGVLHRDLKPSNVMLDGRGRVRIADFGLATLVHSAGDDSRSGTPAYMAPEQLEGREITERSDIYALGLVLYELFTGRHAFDSGRTPSPRAAESRPETPSSHIRSLDPVVERAILRCLEPDPALRPASALAVAAALPGGDALLSALQAGETLSPEMVAASGGAGGLRPLVALGLIAALAGGLAAAIALSERRGLPFAPEDRPYAALRDRADDQAQSLGATHAGDDVVDGFSRDDAAPGEKPVAGAPGIFYWYRRAPAPVPNVLEERIFNGESPFAIPALDIAGAIALRFDLRGRLLEFRRFPAAADTQAGAAADWSPFFAAAGLDSLRMTPASSQSVPPVPARATRAWTAETREGTRHVEGGMYGNRVTFFAVGAPYVARYPDRGPIIARTLIGLVPILLLVIAVYFARRSLIEGRADARGAVRLVTVMGAVGVLGWNILSHPRILRSGPLLFIWLAQALFFIALQAFGYLALEPIVRRRHPEWLVSWTRLLDGRWGDRLVGRDVLMGTVGGVLAVVMGELRGYLGHVVPLGDFEGAAIGGSRALAVVLRGLSVGVLLGMLLALILALLQRATRRNGLGWVLWTPVAMLLLWGGTTASSSWALLLEAAILGYVLHRSGLLGMTAAGAVFVVFNDEYLTTHLGAWYGSVTTTALLVVGIIALWASVVAVRAPRGAPRFAG